VGRDGEASKSDLGQAGREIFLQTGLDRANQIDPLQQIAFFKTPVRSLDAAQLLPDRGLDEQTPDFAAPVIDRAFAQPVGADPLAPSGLRLFLLADSLTPIARPS
jgi:hypothetical protein